MRTVLMLLLLLLASQARGETRFAAQLEPSRDSVTQRVVVPSGEDPQGEVQVIRRGELIVVQTLLASRVLKRVAAAIATRELKRWPEGSAGYAGSLRYREELHRAVGAAWERFRLRDDHEEKRQFLAIEFIAGPRHNLVALSLPVLAGLPGDLRPSGKEIFAVWSAPRDYVLLNSVAIVADSFGMPEDDARALLSALSVDE